MYNVKWKTKLTQGKKVPYGLFYHEFNGSARQGESVKELMRKQLEQAFNALLQEELTAFLQ